jgi:hypothetical protein
MQDICCVILPKTPQLTVLARRLIDKLFMVYVASCGMKDTNDKLGLQQNTSSTRHLGTRL